MNHNNASFQKMTPKSKMFSYDSEKGNSKRKKKHDRSNRDMKRQFDCEM